MNVERVEINIAPGLRVWIDDIKSIRDFCQGCAFTQEENPAFRHIYTKLDALVRGAYKFIDESVQQKVKEREDLERELFPYKNILVEEIYFPARILSKIKDGLRYSKYGSDFEWTEEIEQEEWWISDIMAIPPKEWLKTPGLGKKTFAEIYWKLYSLGAVMDTTGLHYDMRRYLNDTKEENLP